MPSATSTWAIITEEIHKQLALEPLLEATFTKTILRFDKLEVALANRIAEHITDHEEQQQAYLNEALAAFSDDPQIIEKTVADIHALKERDPACTCLCQAFLYSKGFIALQSQRVAHWLWNRDQQHSALMIEHGINVRLAVDMHPAAKIGGGILVDHATGIVVGETAVIGDDVSLLHGVTLGGTGKEGGDRHPKIGNGVLIGANASILGNIHIGNGVKIGAGSVVLQDVPPHVTVVGVPAKIIGKPRSNAPALLMNHALDDI